MLSFFANFLANKYFKVCAWCCDKKKLSFQALQDTKKFVLAQMKRE